MFRVRVQGLGLATGISSRRGRSLLEKGLAVPKLGATGMRSHGVPQKLGQEDILGRPLGYVVFSLTGFL